MKSIFATATAAVFASATLASASLIELSGGAAGSIPGGQTNEVLEDLGLATLGGFFGAEVSLAAHVSDLKIEFIGFEASNNNKFVFKGSDVFSTTQFGTDNTVLPSDSISIERVATFAAAAGLLDFKFWTNGANNTPVGVQEAVNGSNPTNDDPHTANFFASFGVGNEDDTSGDSLYLFFDDAGADDDDNHDDFVIKISAVPLPMSGLMLLAGLGGLGAMGARRRKS